MSNYKNTLTLSLIILLLLNFACSKDDNGPTSSSADFFTYGLIGVRNNGTYTWVYARAFNHPDHQKLEAQLQYDNKTVQLQPRYHNLEKYFTDENSAFSFSPNTEYRFQMTDGLGAYTGEIYTLPCVEIKNYNIIDNQIYLEWTDVGADFYNIELNGLDFEKHYQVEDTTFTVSLDVLPADYPITSIRIYVDGFKGINPLRSTGGNIEGCHGYLFGYTYDYIYLDLPTMSFKKIKHDEPPRNPDDYILSMLNNRANYSISQSTADISFMFSFAYITSWPDFYCVTLFEPLGSINFYEGYLNGDQLDFAR